MTDWGDYTREPWTAENCPLDETMEHECGLAIITYPHNSDGRFKQADARLISKTYLIPKLEAAVEDWRSYLAFIDSDPASNTGREAAVLAALLEELGSS